MTVERMVSLDKEEERKPNRILFTNGFADDLF